MKVAIVGSRGLEIDNIGEYIPDGVSEIITGGAKGVDTSAERYAVANGIKLTVFLPKYEIYGKSAPLKRNTEIIEAADAVLAFWDGKSRGTRFVINECARVGKRITVIMK